MHAPARHLTVIAGWILLVAGAPPIVAPRHGAVHASPALRDSLDGQLDLSEFIIESNGFVPVPIVITEPALGGFGGGFALVFLKKKPPQDAGDTVRAVPPDITAVAGAYTANDSWLVGGGRSATLERQRLRYRAGLAYASMHIDFYEALSSGNEQAFGVHLRTAPLYLSLARQLGDPRFYLGAEYTFAHTRLSLETDSDRPSFVTDDDLESRISALGAIAEFDGRDNIFTPDRGMKVYASFNWSDDWLGSEYRYGKLESFVYAYLPIVKASHGRGWIGGLRLEARQSFGDPPFYLVPYLDLRGVAAMRYQGRTNLLMETEQRIDFTRRWSSVVFGGLGKAFDADEFDEAKLVYSYGTGLRYLMARQFKLRMGLDVARGPEDWAYYIIFGSAWTR